MKCLVLGGTGMLGHKLVQIFEQDFDDWTTIRRPFSKIERFGIFDGHRTIESVDVRDVEYLRQVIQCISPNVVVNAVGIIKQDKTHIDPAEMTEINAGLPHRLACLSQELTFRLITVSTDCVFSGRKGNYRESDVADAPDMYGKTKLIG